MSDLIRRQDAELILAREMYATALKNGCDPVSPVDFLPEAKAWMSDAPTIGGWIPCSERLPETEEDFLCIDADENYEVGCYSLSFKHFFFDSCSDIGKPIAWMPIPEPYKAESEEI